MNSSTSGLPMEEVKGIFHLLHTIGIRGALSKSYRELLSKQKETDDAEIGNRLLHSMVGCSCLSPLVYYPYLCKYSVMASQKVWFIVTRISAKTIRSNNTYRCKQCGYQCDEHLDLCHTRLHSVSSQVTHQSTS